VPAGDVEALANIIRSCLDTAPESLKTMGDAAFARVVESHNVDQEAAKLATLFSATARSLT
jgi:colanic acid/amylovoran biosynthesis glycosyltransferase